MVFNEYKKCNDTFLNNTNKKNKNNLFYLTYFHKTVLFLDFFGKMSKKMYASQNVHSANYPLAYCPSTE